MIEAQVATSTAAVGAFLAEHVSERAQKRKDTIGLGLKAAEERDKYARMLHSNADSTGPTSDPGSGIVTASLRGLDPPSLPTAATLGSASMEVVPGVRSRGMTLAITAAVVGVALGIAGLMALATSGPSGRAAGTTTSMATAPPPPIVTAAPPSPPAPSATASPPPSSVVTATASAAPAALPVHPTGRPLQPSGARPAATVKPRVNDGF